MNVSGDSYPSFKLTEKTSSPLPRKLDAQGNSFHLRTKPRRRVKLHRLPEPKETQPHSLCSQSWWPPPTRTAPQATVPCRTRPSPPTVRASRRAAPAAGQRAGRGRRLPGLAGARTPITGSHEEPGRHALAQPRGPAPRSPPGHSSPFMRTPRAAAAAASAAAVAVRPDWLAAGAPALSHGPRRVRLTGGAAGAALAQGQANPGARGGAGRWLAPGWCPGPAPSSCPPPAHRRPRRPRPPAELPRSRRAAAGQGRAPGAVRSPPRPPLDPPPGGCQSAQRGADWPEPAVALEPRPRLCLRTSPPPPPSLGPWEGAQRGKGMVEF